MPLIKNVEKQMKKVEGVPIHFMKDGKNVRGDANIPTQYAAKRMTKNASSVNYLQNKLKCQYPGYDFEIRKANGTKAPGQMKLSTVRDSFLPDDNLI